MKLSSRSRSIWIEAGVLILLLALGITAFVRSAIKPLNVDDLKISAASLRSYSSLGQQIADRYIEGVLTEQFFRTQTGLMLDNVKKEAKSLSSSTAEPDVQAEHARVTELANRLEDAMSRLNASPRDAGKNKNDLAALFDPLKQVEDELKSKSESK